MASFDSLEDFYASLSDVTSTAIRRFVNWVANAHPEFELVLAWNQPMFRIGTKYIIGFMPTKNYINLATVSGETVGLLGERLAGYRHGGRTITLPFDWTIDEPLLEEVIRIRLVELGLS